MTWRGAGDMARGVTDRIRGAAVVVANATNAWPLSGCFMNKRRVALLRGLQRALTIPCSPARKPRGDSMPRGDRARGTLFARIGAYLGNAFSAVAPRARIPLASGALAAWHHSITGAQRIADGVSFCLGDGALATAFAAMALYISNSATTAYDV